MDTIKKNKSDKIKELTNKKIWLAPLAGYTDNTFRTICKEQGADVVVSEMISADGLIFNREKSLRYARFKENQRPFGIQIFGSDAEVMRKSIEIILPLKPDFIDVNMGCPVKKVVKKGAGSALMKTPELAEQIIQMLRKSLENSGIILSVKIRSGWDRFTVNAIEFAKRMQAAGADILCIHARTRSQMFAGKSDWNLIKEIKDQLQIPVIGNGDIHSVETAISMFEETACDSVMIGRGILGKPWLFQQIKSHINSSKENKLNVEKIDFVPSPQEKLAIIKRHIELSHRENGYDKTVTEIRSHLAYYTKGYKDGAKTRNYVNRCLDLDDIYTAVANLFQANLKAETL